jgi:hypothetical protein
MQREKRDSGFLYRRKEALANHLGITDVPTATRHCAVDQELDSFLDTTVPALPRGDEG